MEFSEKTYLSKWEKISAFHLWNSEYPVNLNYSSLSQFEDYLELLEDHSHLFVLIDGQIKGWYFDFLREEGRWFGLILSSEIQGRGVGTRILSHIKTKRKELHGWIIPHNSYLKANGKPYRSPREFYFRNGFDNLPHIELKTEKFCATKIEWRNQEQT